MCWLLRVQCRQGIINARGRRKLANQVARQGHRIGTSFLFVFSLWQKVEAINLVVGAVPRVPVILRVLWLRSHQLRRRQTVQLRKKWQRQTLNLARYWVKEHTERYESFFGLRCVCRSRLTWRRYALDYCAWYSIGGKSNREGYRSYDGN